MNQLLAVTTAFIITVTLLVLGKKPGKLSFKRSHSNLISEKSTSFPSLVESKLDSNFREENFNNLHPEINWRPPVTAKERLDVQKELFRLISLSPEERLKATQIAGLWGHSSVLPILRRGLRDSDIRVVHAAAISIENHKSSPTKKLFQPTARPPRNVALMR